MTFGLPTTVTIAGNEYDIRSDYRDILQICVALGDPDLSDNDKAWIALIIFYPRLQDIPMDDMQAALRQCMEFISCGESDDDRKSPRLVDWEQDYNLLIAPINRVAGKEIRSVDYLHWWTFVSYYQEIGDCTFAQVVSIRSKKARGKPLDKADREWYNANRKIVDIKTKYTSAEEDFIRNWGD